MQQPKIKYHTVRDNILQKQTKTATNLDLNQVSVLEQGLTNIQNSWILIAKNSISSHNLVWLWQQSSEGSLYFSCPNVEEMKMQLYEQNTWILFRMCTSEETLPPFLPPSLSSFFLPSQSWLVSSEELLLIHKSKKQRHLEKKNPTMIEPHLWLLSKLSRELCEDKQKQDRQISESPWTHWASWARRETLLYSSGTLL